MKRIKTKALIEQADPAQPLAGKARQQDTRRKILLGALVLYDMQTNPAMKERIDYLCSRYLERNDDRALFALPPKPHKRRTLKARQNGSDHLKTLFALAHG